VNAPSHLVDPRTRGPLTPVAAGLRAADGRVFPEACGGWDLRPDAGDANNALQAEIYDAKLGEFTDFAHPHNLMLVHQRDMLDRLELGHGDRVLEIGGHRSGALAYLERRGIVGSGADIARVWVAAQNAAARARTSETRWVVADAEALPFRDGSFAAIVAFDVLEHVSRLDRALAECARVLRPGGTLVCHLPVRDIEGSFDGIQRWWDAADYAARQASAGHFHERLPTRLQMRTRLEHVGLQVRDVQSFNVWLQPLHDHRLMPLLGRVRHALRPARTGTGNAAAATAPRVGASGFQKAYARVAVPLARALSAPDRVGSLLGIGGSCSFVARKP
jgi:SAM-dependent methyltransferase